MKVICLLLSVSTLWFTKTNEKILLNKLKKLYENKAYKWQIKSHYYKMAKFYSYKKSADKAFIMLTRANQLGKVKLTEVYKDPVFKSLRSLKYWQFFDKILNLPVNYTVNGYILNKKSKIKQRLYTRILKKILNSKLKKNINNYKNYIVIKAYTKGGVSAYEKFYKFDKNKNIFLPYKICQYTYDGKKKFEYYIKTKKSLFYFYYKNNEWVVYYNENKGKIDWGLY